MEDCNKRWRLVVSLNVFLFSTGFNEIIDADTLQHIQSQEISACELRIMVCGVAEVSCFPLSTFSCLHLCPEPTLPAVQVLHQTEL